MAQEWARGERQFGRGKSRRALLRRSLYSEITGRSAGREGAGIKPSLDLVAVEQLRGLCHRDGHCSEDEFTTHSARVVRPLYKRNADRVCAIMSRPLTEECSHAANGNVGPVDLHCHPFGTRLLTAPRRASCAG